ncbi:MAG: DMT family transporter [Acidobacteria bacterium]|nr:DMT family transporter [Acidobacteriota bacterium]
MKLQFYAMTLFLGVVLTVHLAMNGMVGAAIGNPRVANALFWCIGAVTAVVVGITGWKPGALSGLGQVNPLLLTAGVAGALLVFAIAKTVPEVGAGPFFVLLLAGQVLSAMVISHFGWFGSPVQTISPMHAVGAVVMVVGVYLTTK